MLGIAHTILHTHWISWIMHFFGFLIFMRFSGIKPAWAVGLVFGIEIWEMLDWSLQDPIRWWRMPDTWIDIAAGLLGIYLGMKLCCRPSKKNLEGLSPGTKLRGF